MAKPVSNRRQKDITRLLRQKRKNIQKPIRKQETKAFGGGHNLRS